MTKMYSYLIAVGGVLLAVIGVFLKGKKAGREKEQFNQLKANIETKKRMKNAETINSSNALKRVLHKGKF